MTDMNSINGINDINGINSVTDINNINDMSSVNFCSMYINNIRYTTTKPFDLLNDDLDELSKSYYIVVDRDYHGRKIYEPISLFTFLTDLEAYMILIHRFDENIISYVDSNNENILHLTAKNANPECLETLLNIIPDSYLFELSNSKSNFGYYPIELINNVDLFKRMLCYTKMDYRKLLKCMSNSSEIAQHVCDVYQSYIENEE